MGADAKEMEDLLKELDIREGSIVRDPHDPKRHNLKADVLVRLAEKTGLSLYYEQALESCNQAIALTNCENPVYLINRAKIYSIQGKLFLALQEVTAASMLPTTDGLDHLYVKAMEKDLLKSCLKTLDGFRS